MMPCEANGSESDNVKRDLRNGKGSLGGSDGVLGSRDDRSVDTELEVGL